MGSQFYSHIGVQYTLLLYSFTGHDFRIGRNILQIDHTCLPELFQQPRALYNSQEFEFLRDSNFENLKKNKRVLQSERMSLFCSSLEGWSRTTGPGEAAFAIRIIKIKEMERKTG